MSRILLRISTFIMLLPCGCMTFQNVAWLRPENRIYGGIRLDAEQVCQSLSWSKEQKEKHLGCRLGDIGFAMWDFPFSLVGDTLTLPITVTATLKGNPPEWQGLSSVESLPPTSAGSRRSEAATENRD